MKYIIVKIYGDNRVFLFEKDIQHDLFWNDIKHQGYEVVSAGLFIAHDGDMICVHGSTTLGIEQNDEQGKKDLEIIREELTGMAF